MQTQGRKEVAEAVVIAALTTLAAGLVKWGIEHTQEYFKQRKKRKKDRDKDGNVKEE